MRFWRVTGSRMDTRSTTKETERTTLPCLMKSNGAAIIAAPFLFGMHQHRPISLESFFLLTHTRLRATLYRNPSLSESARS